MDDPVAQLVFSLGGTGPCSRNRHNLRYGSVAGDYGWFIVRDIPVLSMSLSSLSVAGLMSSKAKVWFLAFKIIIDIELLT